VLLLLLLLRSSSSFTVCMDPIALLSAQFRRRILFEALAQELKGA
jgi:hypothetical protein